MRAFTRELDRVVEGWPHGHFRASPDQGAALAAAIVLHLSTAPVPAPDHVFVRTLARCLRRAESHGRLSRVRPAQSRAWGEPTVGARSTLR
jgi:hypothetical protein